ncbi:uncharacterized protein LY89DRAFT_547987, partial [Mollisia scopiformis]
HHRQNRRRERPGSRTRRSMNRKANAPFDYTDSLLDARDASVYLPSDKAKPSPLLRQNFDQSWQRWQARKAEEKALAEMDMRQLEIEQQRLFGEDVDDEVSIPDEAMLGVVFGLFGDLDYIDP